MKVPEKIVLVATGKSSKGASQVIDLLNTTRYCSLQDYPTSPELKGASGGVLDNSPVICGGKIALQNGIMYEGKFVKECNKFDESTKEWKVFARLKVIHFQSKHTFKKLLALFL